MMREDARRKCGELVVVERECERGERKRGCEWNGKEGREDGRGRLRNEGH